MKKHRLGRHILSLGLAALVFVSTIGIPVHAMYCVCLGERVVGLFVEVETSCSSGTELKGVCERSRACCKPEPACCSVAGDTDCMHRELSICKIDLDLITGHSPDHERDGAVYSVGLTPAFHNASLPLQRFYASFYPHGPPGPMTPYEGQSAYIAYSQFRC